MGFILWIIFGGLVGWMASLIMKTDAQQGFFVNIIVGMIGAVIGGWIMSAKGTKTLKKSGHINPLFLLMFVEKLIT